jgi:plastocyanin
MASLIVPYPKPLWENEALKLWISLLPLLLLAACGSGPQAETKPQASLPEAHVDPATAGSITGSVAFTGDVPVMPVIDFSSNPQCERAHKTPVKAETVIVNPNHTLKNVFVWIKDGLPAGHWAPPANAATLNQNGCIYEPHVMGIMAGQQLEILNSDPVNHNVHAESVTNPPWNESQPPRAEHKFKTFGAEEVLFPVTCSVHPWMRSYIGVSPHPFFGVTGDDGTFTLQGVPPGSYTIEAVHEKYGKKEGKLTLAPSGKATIDFTYGG